MDSDEINSQALPRGTRLKEFVIERVLGTGGFGITYLATDTSLDRQVVIKENLPAQFCFRDTHSLTVAPRHTEAEDAENFVWSLENFSKEAAMLASLDHRGIVKVLRSFQGFGTAYFVMPFVEGLTLDGLLSARRGRKESFSEDELKGLLEHVLDALAYLHERGIYHRDIKPGNILITAEGVPVLIDFGSARQRLSERSMTVVESAGYTPFEQLQSRGNVGPWSDLYALGGTVYKALTGETPPKATDRAFDDPLESLAERESLRGDYSREFLASVDRALGVRVEDRWQGAGEWLKALGGEEAKVQRLDQGDEDLPTAGEVKPVEEKPETGNGKKRNAWRMTVGALLLLGLLGVAGMIAFWSGQPKVGGFVVSSEPAGALVKDALGKELGVTPLELKGLPAEDRWSGTVELDGYEPGEVETEVMPGEMTVMETVILEASPQEVIVTSKPSGAEVLEDGRVVGRTPYEVLREPLEAVEYTLRLEDHEEAVLSGRVAVGERLVLSANLKPLSLTKFAGSEAGEERAFEIAPGVRMEFCWIPPGEFVMGSPATEMDLESDENQVRVRISGGFWLGKYEVTQGEWETVMGSKPSIFKGSGRLPVENVSWEDICGDESRRGGFLGKVGRMAPEGWRYDLPSEAQWEYACRAGMTGAYAGELDRMGWYRDNSGGETHEVGGKAPNAWGLYDMHGNVYEWCLDWYASYSVEKVTDPVGPKTGSDPVFRGGSWNSVAGNCRSADRFSPLPGLAADDDGDFGFRAVLAPGQ